MVLPAEDGDELVGSSGNVLGVVKSHIQHVISTLPALLYLPALKICDGSNNHNEIEVHTQCWELSS